MVRKKKSLGPAFSEAVRILKIRKYSRHQKVPQTEWKDFLIPKFDPDFAPRLEKNPWALLPFSAICVIIFFMIFLRLFHLQIVQGKYNRELADGNRIQIKIIHAQRGVIFDRNGKILAANSPAFRLTDTDSKKVRLISREQALELEVKDDPKKTYEVDNVRYYLLGEKSAHVIGYTGEISEGELKEARNYRIGDRIGRTGIEAQYEKILRGKDGGEIIEVDSQGSKLRQLRRNTPTPGQNIYLTIDADLQQVVYRHLKEALTKTGSCCAAAVAMDPTNGQILAFVSLPSFDPNIFTSSYDEGAISEMFSKTEAPILNRVIAGTYPPGSTFKIVSSLAALSSGKVTADTTFVDNGVVWLGPYKFTNWYFTDYGKVEGAVNLVKALRRSNDTYYYEIGRLLGEIPLTEWSKKLYLGKTLGIDIPGEVNGLVPSDEWKRKTYNQVWYPGDTLHMSIGQGFVLTTPLQILGITSFIAADGNLYKPQLLKTNFKPQILVANLASEEQIKLIKTGLSLVTKEGGTAWPFFTFPIPTAGKTGTAEFGDPKDRTHAWYTAFAPVDNPKIALTILVEGGGQGSSVAAPIAKEILRWYFSPDKSKLIEDVIP